MYISDSIVSICLYVSVLNIQRYILTNLPKCQMWRWHSGKFRHQLLCRRVFEPWTHLRGFVPIRYIFDSRFSVPSPGLSRHFPFAFWPNKNSHTCKYMLIQQYTCIFTHILTYTCKIHSYTYICPYVNLSSCM